MPLARVCEWRCALRSRYRARRFGEMKARAPLANIRSPHSNGVRPPAGPIVTAAIVPTPAPMSHAPGRWGSAEVSSMPRRCAVPRSMNSAPSAAKMLTLKATIEGVSAVSSPRIIRTHQAAASIALTATTAHADNEMMRAPFAVPQGRLAGSCKLMVYLLVPARLRAMVRSRSRIRDATRSHSRAPEPRSWPAFPR